jgi:hypothetical protein
MKATLVPAAALLVLLTGLSPTIAAQSSPKQTTPTPPAASPTADSKATEAAKSELFAEYKKRIDAYLKVHDEAKKNAPALKQTSDPAEIKQAQDALGARIRELRANAKQGDVFSPEIVTYFRTLLVPPLNAEDSHKTKAVLKDDAPPPEKINFAVNAKYPSSETLPTVPGKVLLHLPTLPKTLEYRIIGKALVLRDVDADIIVDFFPNAIA